MILRRLPARQLALASRRLYATASTSSAQSKQQQEQQQARDAYQAEIMRRAQFMHRNQLVPPVPQQGVLQHKPHRVQQFESAEQQARKNRGVIITLGVLLLATPAIIYAYWQHRDQHMREKKEHLLKEVQERYKRYG